MNKLLAIFACLFYLFALSFASSVEVPETGPFCLIYYDEYSEGQQCQIVIGDDGEEAEECEGQGTMTLAAVLTPEENSFVEKDFRMSSFNFFEDCNCIAKYFKGSQASGCPVKKQFAKGDKNVVATEEVVSWRPNSFAFECQF